MEFLINWCYFLRFRLNLLTYIHNKFVIYQKWTTINTVTIEPILMPIMTSFHKHQWPIVNPKISLLKSHKVKNIWLHVLGDEFSDKKLKWVKSKKTTSSSLHNDTPLKIELHWTKSSKEIFKLSIFKEQLQAQKSVKASEISSKHWKLWSKKIKEWKSKYWQKADWLDNHLMLCTKRREGNLQCKCLKI